MLEVKAAKSQPSAGLALSSAQSRCLAPDIQRALPLGCVLATKILGPVAELTICCSVPRGRSPFPANGVPRVEFRIRVARGMSGGTPRQATTAGRLAGKKSGPAFASPELIGG
jgi:hypothetical protein